MTLGRASSLFVAKKPEAVYALHGQAAKQNSLCSTFPMPAQNSKSHVVASASYKDRAYRKWEITSHFRQLV